jgi:hypothetical protein
MVKGNDKIIGILLDHFLYIHQSQVRWYHIKTVTIKRIDAKED